MKITYGAWELSEGRPSAFDTFHCPPDFWIEIDEDDWESEQAFQKKTWAENSGKKFCFGDYHPEDNG